MKSILLTPRDLSLLIGVYRHGFLLRDHAWKLYFSGCELRRATRRFLALKEHQLLEASPLPLGAFAFGIQDALPGLGQFSYRLGAEGIPLVAQALGVDAASIRKRLRNSPSFTGHAVAVASLHEAIHRLQDEGGYRLTQFLTEGEARQSFEWRTSSTSEWKRAEVRPDGLAWIERDGLAIPYLIEADLAHQSKAAIATKLAGYALWIKTPIFKERFDGAPLRLLIVTLSKERLTVLYDLVCESELSGCPGIALTTFRDFISQGPMNPIWLVPASGTERNHLHALPLL